MADAPVVHIGENSPEQVAFKLLDHIARVENINIHVSQPREGRPATRLWILHTYAQCMAVVNGDEPNAAPSTGEEWLRK